MAVLAGYFLLRKLDQDNWMFSSEPAVLLMYHSIRNHAAITHSLLDFLCRVSKLTHRHAKGHMIHCSTVALHANSQTHTLHMLQGT